MHAAITEGFRRGYIEICQKCRIPGYKDAKADAIPQLVKKWLQDDANGTWLLIIDNADNSEDFFPSGVTQYQPSKLIPDEETPLSPKLREYIPRCAHGSILITTKTKEVAVKFLGSRIEVPTMTPKESEDLICTILTDPNHDRHKIQELTSLFEYLPLAIVQAAAYMEETSMNIDTYLEVYRENEESALELLSQAFESEGRDYYIPNAVATSWMIFFDQIRALNPRAADILSMMAWFDRQAVPKPLLKNQEERCISFEGAVGKLVAYSLIIKNAGDKSFDIHRLAHLISRRWLKQHGIAEKWSIKAEDRILDRFPTEDYQDWGACHSYLPHAEAIIKDVVERNSNKYRKSTPQLMHIVGRYLSFSGSHMASKTVRELHLGYCKKHLGQEHPSTLQCVSDLAVTLWQQGDYDKAESLHQRALDGREKILGLEHLDTIWSMSSLAVLKRNQG